MLLLLVPEAARAVSVGPNEVAGLADLGVTDVTLMRDGDAIAVILEGWALEPAGAARAAARVLMPDRTLARAFQTVAHVAVSAAEPNRQA